ncbi:sigma-70 family RNA polymerase sigma factor [Modestobacter marinus]|uniref:sigma-70 family RNA polymerase sigma factor n=1 Tax=Modestobacter marinus TaxID=477641 RepID=UPI0027E098B7|nr:sigma-70 family RNA polymerase sigma factor [Modestobacter marinus]
MVVGQLERLAAQAAGGDVAAQAALVRETQADVWRLCAHLADRQVAEDLTQETYLRALPALRRFEGRSGVRTWLLSIARRVCADHLRRRARRPLVLVGEDTDLGALVRDVPADEVGGTVAAQDVLDRLEPERREAFVLTQLIGLPYVEAAEVVGCPVGTIRSRVARARADLVEALVAADHPRTRRPT